MNKLGQATLVIRNFIAVYSKVAKLPFILDQHGNILSNNDVSPKIQQPPVRSVQVLVASNSKPSNGNASSDIVSTTNVDPPKKESRLKHFFSPIRKKPIVPPPEQPDVFISNILPSNMYVNPMHLQNSLPEISPRPPDSFTETSPTTSFQVRIQSKYKNS
jgi:hypothetical protein